MMVDWLRTLVLRGDDIEVRKMEAGEGTVRFIDRSGASSSPGVPS
jgi:hypothetical protein